ncbi:MAG: hypothetical protein A2504_16385 [Bdellovibrionales bacterium RIFOXYD12_FULL_39_22]|nr:MAG: hypothetical protein A2385_10040 [Bdellovibrionales bacterium RIFOXYB1_FULL_39_21]OFZ45441.1 MAG: hypothetical protein A2404_01285 [Bdellovibrionales bacterium RIFOXYC1_FULL_39_130]OFZ70407.1 MAG: hypothetical protein A2451_08250 [Bdellovibrionales bacterium RIFOXYC2_FULL_39_8]OFZ74644.1 MAG: hypothetical protein A2560_09610 [Bdellovibrionales bacterium RIFOXYD1_FULL_39_84]OFZ92953.1 MAG: hypothetical protein A2504_16385 [Bdellovibrionales bacterium RIFOXYD12_FULL_39_22]HLE12804.1 hypo
MVQILFIAGLLAALTIPMINYIDTQIKDASHDDTHYEIESMANHIRIILAKEESCNKSLSSVSGFPNIGTGKINEIFAVVDGSSAPLYKKGAIYDGVTITDFEVIPENAEAALVLTLKTKSSKSNIKKKIALHLLTDTNSCRSVVNPDAICDCDGKACFTVEQLPTSEEPSDEDIRVIRACLPRKGWVNTGETYAE